MPERTIPVPVGGLSDVPYWELLLDYALVSSPQGCPHCHQLPDGTWVLPHGLLAFTDGGLGSSVLCYDCVRLAVHRHCPAWETSAPEVPACLPSPPRP
jgi:hypothetical protein